MYLFYEIVLNVRVGVLCLYERVFDSMIMYCVILNLGFFRKKLFSF